MSDIVFMDTETLGVQIDSPIWEFAAIRRSGKTGEETALHLFIHHHSDAWLDGPDALPKQFADDYRSRFKYEDAVAQSVAADLILSFLSGRPHIVGAVPNFDTERISHQLLRPKGAADPWHYHLIDVENLVAGRLFAQLELVEAVTSGAPIKVAGAEHLLRALMTPPWDSNNLSRAIGVDPDQFNRHTAMGDVEWVRAQYDAVTGGGK